MLLRKMELDTKIIPYTYCMDCFNSEEEIEVWATFKKPI